MKGIVVFLLGLVICSPAFAQTGTGQVVKNQVSALSETLKYIVDNNILGLADSKSSSIKTISPEGDMWRIEFIKNGQCQAMVGGPDLGTVMFQATLFECK